MNDANKPAAAKPDALCPFCKGAGWICKDVPVGHRDFGRAFPCSCSMNAIEQKRATHLAKLSNLREDELTYRLDNMTRHNRNQQAIHAVEEILERQAGLATFYGLPGVGKTRLMISAINAERLAGRVAIYAKMAELLNFLRDAFDPDRPNGDQSYDRRWQELIEAHMLAIDELDAFKATSWAMERFEQLIDERWRRMRTHITMLALNTDPSGQLPKVVSRLQDGRGEIIQVAGPDMRPVQEWNT